MKQMKTVCMDCRCLTGDAGERLRQLSDAEYEAFSASSDPTHSHGICKPCRDERFKENDRRRAQS